MASINGKRHSDTLADKKTKNVRVTSHTTRPPTISPTPHSAMKSYQPERRRSRVSSKYPGSSKGICGFEAGKQGS
jgi:hypothetical protein